MLDDHKEGVVKMSKCLCCLRQSQDCRCGKDVSENKEQSIEEIAAIAVEEYDAGTLKPEMAGRLATRTLISNRDSVLLIETIDRWVDQHQEDEEYGN